MKIETSKSVLKVCGVIDMIYGILEILLGIMTTAGGGLISAVSVTEADVPEVAGPLVLVFGIGIVLMGVFSLAEGIVSRKAATDPSKARPAFVFAVISLVLTGINLVASLVNGGSPVSAIVGVALNGLLVAAAYTMRKEATPASASAVAA